MVADHFPNLHRLHRRYAPDTNRHYISIEPQRGSWDASFGHHGKQRHLSGVHGEGYNCPAEFLTAVVASVQGNTVGRV